MPAGQRAVGVPEDLGVIVGVEIDEAGSHVQAGGIDHLGRIICIDTPHGGDVAILDTDIAADTGSTRAVKDHSVLDDDVERVVSHSSSPYWRGLRRQR